MVFAGLTACVSIAAFAGDYPPPISPAEFPLQGLTTIPSMAGWLWTSLASQEAVTVILTIITAIAGYLVRRSWVIKWRLQRAIQCLAAGVRETYEEYVRGVKHGNADGKLTADERDHAMKMALEKAKSFALSQGFDLAKTYAKEYLPVIVERLIGIQKASGRGIPLDPLLPELEPR